MRLVAKFAIVCLLLCPGIAAAAAGNKDYSKEVNVYTDVVYGHKFALAMTMDVLQPKKGNGAGIVWIVSGAWHSGVFPPQAAFSSGYPYAGFFDCRALLDKGFTVFFVRHGDGSKFLLPEIVDDCRRSIRFIRSNAKKYGVDPERLGALGGSAGGHLALMLATTSDEGVPNPRDYDGILRTSDRIAAAVAYFPPTDIRSWFTNGNWKDYEAFRFDPKLAGDYSPLLWVTPHSAPALMIHGDKDVGVPIWHSEKMLAEYKKNSVPCELLVIKGVGHGFDIGFKGFDQYTPAQMQIMMRARAATVAWFEKILLAPRKEAKTAEKAPPAPAPKGEPVPGIRRCGLVRGPCRPLAGDGTGQGAGRPARRRRVADDEDSVAPHPRGQVPDGHAGRRRGGRTLRQGVSCGGQAAHRDSDQGVLRGRVPRNAGTVVARHGEQSELLRGQPQASGRERLLAGRSRRRQARRQGGRDVVHRQVPQGHVAIIRPAHRGAMGIRLPRRDDPALNDPAANKGEGADCTDANLAKIAWFEGNSARQTHDVGLKAPNAWGLYDMCGNVSQWCLDLFGDYLGDATDPVGPPPEKRRGGHILRGGYWSMSAPGCRSSARNYDCANPPYAGRFNVCGLRLALPLGQ